MDSRNTFVLLFLLFSWHIRRVLADLCEFYQGATTIKRTCTEGCCDDGCCADDYKTLAIILGVVFGCLLFIIIITVIVVCLTRHRWSKKIQPQKGKQQNQNKKNDIKLQQMAKVSD